MFHPLHSLFLQTIEEFHNIFGPELKAVTGDPERIDIVIQRVDRLVVDIEIIKFDPFNPSNRLASAPFLQTSIQVERHSHCCILGWSGRLSWPVSRGKSD